MATASKPANQAFLFDDMSSIGDLLNVVKALTNAGQRPTLRFVKSYNGEIESVAVDVFPLAGEPSVEMAVTEGEAYTPDPRD